MKHKLNLDEQIEHMKNKGVKFNLINEQEAKDILSTRTYYFKLKSYAKIYNKDNSGSYINLEFAYMYELSKIDTALRSFILEITLAIEHLTKTLLINDFNQSNEDGYSIVDDFLNSTDGQSTQQSIQIYLNQVNNNAHKGGNYALVQKYHTQMPIWVLIEVISFGNFIKLLNFYEDKVRRIATNINFKYGLDSTKWLRNLSAHSNCLLIKILDTNKQERKHLLNSLKSYKKGVISKYNPYSLEDMMKKSLIVDFLEVINLFFKLCKNENMRNYFIKKFDDFMQYSSNHQNTINSNKELKIFLEFIGKSFNIIIKNL